MATQNANKRFRATLTTALEPLVQVEVARQLGVSPQLLTDWKAGRRTPSPDEVFALERAVGVAPGTLSRHLGYLPVDSAFATASDEIASDAGRTIRDYLGEDVDLVLGDIEDFDVFAQEVVEEGLRRRLLLMAAEDSRRQRGEPVSEEVIRWADEAIDRALAAPQGLFES